MSWVNTASQAMAHQMDETINEEILNNMYDLMIPNKLRFKFRLQGLEFGGVLDKWGLTSVDTHTNMPRTKLSHQHILQPNKHCIFHQRKIGHHKETKLAFTDIVRSHYSEDYVVATNKYYYFLGERTLTHTNINLKLLYTDHFRGITVVALVDCGPAGDRSTEVLKLEISDQLFLMDSSIEHRDMIRANMLDQYKEMIRRGR